MAKKPSGLRKEDPHRPLEQFEYLLKHLSSNPIFSHEGGVFALRFPGGGLQFIHNREQRSFLFAHMRDLARFLNADLVVVQGTWTFTPDVQKITEEADIEEEGLTGND